MEQPSIFRRANGVYYIRTILPGRRQKWRSTGTRNKREAERFLAAYLTGQQPGPRGMSGTVGDAAGAFIEYVKGNHAPNTIKRYERVLALFTDHTGADTSLSSVTSQTIEQYKAHRLQHVRPVTVNTELRHVKALFGYAVRCDMLQASPFRNVPFLKVAEMTPEHLTRAEFARLYAAIREPWFRDVVLFALTTGLRESEICFLRWESVDTSARLLRVESSGEFTTKSRRNRVTPFPGQTGAMLERRRAESGEGYVFTFRGKRIRQDLLSAKFKRYARELGLDDRITFHSLRKTYATWLVQTGASLFAVQRLLGHVSPTTTMQYAAFMPTDLQGIVDGAGLAEAL